MPRFFRKIIKIKAEDSPNVRFALAQIKAGKEPTNEIIVPGVLSWADYQKRRATWDKVRQSIGLDAEFWEGADTLLFPPEWLNRAEQLARLLEIKRVVRRAKAVGIDPAEGGDSTTMAAVDDYGLIDLETAKTPDTNVIIGKTLAFMKKHDVPAHKVVFDRGGGGKQHADRLRDMGYAVRTVAFGESVQDDPIRRMKMISERLEEREERYTYKNRRAEMYGSLRERMDPGSPALTDLWKSVNYDRANAVPITNGFAIPARFAELRRQLAPMPLLYDNEGRMFMLPKDKPTPTYTGQTLKGLIGCSPDEADAVVMAIHAMTTKGKVAFAGVPSGEEYEQFAR